MSLKNVKRKNSLKTFLFRQVVLQRALIFSSLFLALFPLQSLSQCSNCTTRIDGSYTVHEFTESDTFTPPAGVTEVEYLVVGGGGGGGDGDQDIVFGFIVLNRGGGGGGAGGFVTGNLSVTQPTFNILIGAGGGPGNNGSASSFGPITAAGGGGGGDAGDNGNSGASGGGGGYDGSNGNGAGGQGNDGGDGAGGFFDTGAGGGGGAGADGANGAGGTGGGGGAGLSSSLTGSSYAAGGNGGGTTGNGAAGAANTGNGGGGGAGNNTGGSGGSGIVVIRYQALPGQYYTRASGNWSATSTWSNIGCGGGAASTVPHPAAQVTICNGHSVSLNVNGEVAGLAFQAGNQNVSLTHGGSNQLTVGSGGVTINGATGGNNTKAWNINAGTAIVNGPLTLNSGDSNNRISRIQLTTGTLDINGNLTFNSSGVARAVIEMTGAANIFLSGTINPGGNARVIPGTAGTFTYDGAGTQTALLGVSEINYHNLVFAGSGSKSQTTWNTPTITGTTTVSSGVTFNNSAAVIYGGNFINNGTTNVTAAQQYQGNFTDSGSYNTDNSLQTFNGSATQQLTGATTFVRLSLNNATGLTINNDVLVQDQLQLDSGPLITGSNTLRVAQAGGWSGVTRGTGWVAGNLGLWMPTGFQPRTFDIGDGANYRPLQITLPGVTTAGYLVARVSQSAGDHPQIGTSNLDPSLSVNRWWSLVTEGAAAPSMDITFNYLAADVDGGADPQAFEIQRYSGGTWANATAGTRTPTSTQGTGITGFGEFAIAEPAGGAPVPVLEYRMDELVWNGTAGEVVDASGNGNNGTAVGGVDTNDTSPAIAGDPGTCRYGEFNGVDDYVEAGSISDTLNATASLAFWINTTQTGSNTAWQAPGVTGVEEEGGADDIFWGWLDANGNIGVSVGNTFTTKSTVPINNGTWRHVVLTRDHSAGTYKIYIDGVLNTSGSIATGIVGNGYSSIGRIQDTSDSPEYLDGLLDEVRIYNEVLSDSEVAAIWQETHPCAVEFCPSGTPRGGLPGDYYNNMNLSGTAIDTRVDGPVNFNWTDGAPGVPGVGANQFSVDWNGYIRATETGNYRFQTVSDDGVRLWVDNQQVINNWTDHAVQTNTSAVVSLTAGEVYPIRLQFYENGGQAEIRLRWQTPSSGGFVPIPSGPEPAVGAGLYYCDSTVVLVDHYDIHHAGTGLTCEAELITITAHDSAHNAMAPAAGTQITLSTTPAGGTWMGGNTVVFNGSTVSADVYLQQTMPATLNINVTDGLATESGSEDPDITFAEVGLRFYGNDTLATLPNQVAGELDSNPVIRVVEADTDGETCQPRIQNESRDVGLAYECRDPGTCSIGQTLNLAGTSVQAHDSGAAITYTNITLAFDANGFASIPLEYSDVGRIRLHGRVHLPAEGDEPEIFIPGTSSEFIVKPYTFEVVRVEKPDGTLHSNPADGLVAAGENFTLVVESRNADGAITPAYGRESTPETMRVELTNLVAPDPAGNLGILSGASSFNPVAGVSGQEENTALSWNEVGSFTVTPRLGDDDYMDAGDLASFTESGTIGRFYPFEYVLASSGTTDACGIFSYLGQPDIEVTYRLEARGSGTGILTNYDTSLGYAGTATVGFVAENANDGDDQSSRVAVLPSGSWAAGAMEVLADNSGFSRQGGPEAPFTQLQLGLTLTDVLDGRPLTNLNMNAATSGDCVSAGDCDAVMLGDEIEVRFGRLRLSDAFGPETAPLPVNFVTEYWDGSVWVQNTDDDDCTQIAAADITYPSGTIDDAANLETDFGDGSSTGSYADLNGVVVSFNDGDAGQFFSAPGAGNMGAVTVDVDMSAYGWLQFDWDQDGSHTDSELPTATFTFGSYRGHDRIIFWREVLQ